MGRFCQPEAGPTDSAALECTEAVVKNNANVTPIGLGTASIGIRIAQTQPQALQDTPLGPEIEGYIEFFGIGHHHKGTVIAALLDALAATFAQIGYKN